MPNIVNTRMLAEIEGFLKEAEDCVLVDFTGMPVGVTEEVRSTLRRNQIRMRVLKTSLARRAARGLGYEGADEVLDGPAAMVYGGESVAHVARTVRDIAREKKAPAIRGGFLDKKAVGPEAVEQLANLPTRDELLAQVLGTIIAPMTQTVGAIQSLLAAAPGLAKALEDKLGGAESEGGADG